MKGNIVARAVLCALVLASAPATAKLTEITVTSVEPFADEAAFGEAGAYEREAAGDPRPSLEERYGDHAGYVSRVEQAVKKLVAERLLLAEDGAVFIAKARAEETAKRFPR